MQAHSKEIEFSSPRAQTVFCIWTVRSMRAKAYILILL